MQSHWSDEEAADYVARYGDAAGSNEDLALRVYTSRLIGRCAGLVLHGGGNTSVKTRLRDDLGELCDVLCVKGSGWDLSDIEPRGLPAVRLAPLQALRRLTQLSDEAMVNAQRIRMLDATAPNPSVEALLHAFLPHKFVDHSHADAILSLVDQPEAERVCREVFGDRLAIVPYVMPGFQLGKLAAEVQAAHPQAEGLVLLKHGLFTFADTARESYERHIRAVDLAERHIARCSSHVAVRAVPRVDYASLAPLLRGALGSGARHYLLTLRDSPDVRGFVERSDLTSISQRGVATPDHVIRTKPLPLVLDPAAHRTPEALAAHIAERIGAFRAAYHAYVARKAHARGRGVQPLDPDPRVVLVPGLGLIGVGTTGSAAAIAADLYEHTMRVIADAERIGRYEVLGESDLFDMEYWSLEQAKLGKERPKPLAGRVVYITGAARGLGAATARAFHAHGAALYLVDRDGGALAETATTLGARHEALDMTDETAVISSVRRAVEAYGGIDGLVSNAGTAPQGPMHEGTRALTDSLAINLLSHQYASAAVTRVLRAQGTGGFLLFNASKSAFNPGADFGPYAIPKAALVALMKQYALENGGHGIRANAVNADRVRTRLLPQHEVAGRALARGLTPEAYYRANLLGREVTADDVAAAFVYLALAPSTTGCTLTVDGGNIAASPR